MLTGNINLSQIHSTQTSSSFDIYGEVVAHDFLYLTSTG